MLVQQFAQPRELRNNIVGVIPGEPATGMHIHPLRREPFHTARVREPTRETRQSAKLVSQERPRAPLRRKPWVIMRLAVMHQRPRTRAFYHGVIEITAHLDR